DELHPGCERGADARRDQATAREAHRVPGRLPARPAGGARRRGGLAVAKKKDAKPGANDGDQARESSASAAAHGRAKEPEKIKEIDSEYLSGRRYPYQEAIEEIEDVDLLAATPGE